MNTPLLVVRRVVIVLGVICTLAVGLGAIGASAAWTRDMADLGEPPTSVADLQARIATERSRSDVLIAQLEAMTVRTGEMAAALEAARSRIEADAAHAAVLADDLAAARKRLAKLEASIRSARTTISTTSVAPARSTDRGGDEHEREDDEHEREERDDD